MIHGGFLVTNVIEKMTNDLFFSQELYVKITVKKETCK